MARTGLRCAKPGYAPLGMTKEAGMALRNSREWLHGLKTFIFSLTCAASRLLGMTKGARQLSFSSREWLDGLSMPHSRAYAYYDSDGG